MPRLVAKAIGGALARVATVRAAREARLRAGAAVTAKCEVHFGPLPCLVCRGLREHAERKRAPMKDYKPAPLLQRPMRGEIKHGRGLYFAEREARAHVQLPRPWHSHDIYLSGTGHACRVCGDDACVAAHVLYPVRKLNTIWLCGPDWMKIRDIGWRFTGKDKSIRLKKERKKWPFASGRPFAIRKLPWLSQS